MMDPQTAYFLKKYYRNIIKWYFVMYNPEAIRIWPSKSEEREALRKEEQERLAKEAEEAAALEAEMMENNEFDYCDEEYGDGYNATTGSYSGLYGQQPVDDDTQAAFDAIMNNNSHGQSTVDFLLAGGEPTTSAAYSINSSDSGNDTSASSPFNDVEVSPEQEDIIKEANLIYERLMREAAEDEAKKQAEIEAAKQIAEQSFAN